MSRSAFFNLIVIVFIGSAFSFTTVRNDNKPGQKTELAPPDNFSAAKFVFSTSADLKAAKVGDVIELIFATDIEEGLSIYGVINHCEVGPLPPSLNDVQLKGVELEGGLFHGSVPHKMIEDDIFKCSLSKFVKKAEIRQKVKITAANPSISGRLNYQMCSYEICKSFDFAFDSTK